MKLSSEHAACAAAVEALTVEWLGPGPTPPHGVAHQDPQSGLVTFHLHGLPDQLNHILAALRALRRTGLTRSTFTLKAADPARATIEAVRLADDAADPDQEQDWEAIAAWCHSKVDNHAIADSGEYTSTIPLPNGPAGEGDWIVHLTDETGARFEMWPNTRFVAAVTDPPDLAVQDAAEDLLEEDGWLEYGHAIESGATSDDCTDACGHCAKCAMFRVLNDGRDRFGDYLQRARAGTEVATR